MNGRLLFAAPRPASPVAHCRQVGWHHSLMSGAACCGLLLVASLASAQDITVFNGRTMGPIPYTVRAVLPDGTDAVEVHDQIVATLSDINEQMSTYIPESELSRFNASRETDTWFPVSDATAQVVAEALAIAAKTKGAFDPTVGPLVNLWRFGPEKGLREVPSDEAIDEAKARVGFAKVSVRRDPPALKKSAPDVALDLSAIAKGYAVDAIAKTLHDIGCKAYMVEIGGEVVARGRKPGGIAWNIGIEKPTADGTLNAILPLDDAALATSGDYRNYYEVGGRRYSHTMDPATGRPVDHTLATASVQAPTCMEADALATTLMVMGPQRGLEFANEHDIAALLVSYQGTGFLQSKSAAWQTIYPDNNAPNENTPSETPAAQETDKAMPVDTIWLVAIVAVVFALVILAMSVGAIFAGKRIRGSCGGIAGSKDAEGNLQCSLCRNPSPDCTGQETKASDVPHSTASQQD